MDDAAALRRKMRMLRRAVSEDDRRRMSRAAAAHAFLYIESIEAVKTVGVYLAMREEIDCMPLTEQLWNHGYKVYLPVVREKNAPLVWRVYRRDSQFTADALQIPVPALENAGDERNIAPDITVMPLTVYDNSGTRIGMGGGYYDRSFADKKTAQRLLGLAYSLQQVPRLNRQAWDVPMHALANEHSLLTFS